MADRHGVCYGSCSAGGRGDIRRPVLDHAEDAMKFEVSLYPTWRRCPSTSSCGNLKMKTWYEQKTHSFFYVCPRCQAAELVQEGKP